MISYFLFVRIIRTIVFAMDQIFLIKHLPGGMDTLVEPVEVLLNISHLLLCVA